MEHLSIRQTANKWGISKRRVQTFSWVIPADVEKPKDERIRSGKYVKLSRKEEK